MKYIKVNFTDRVCAFYTDAVLPEMMTEPNVVDIMDTDTGEMLFVTDRPLYDPMPNYKYDWNLRMMVRIDDKRPDLLADKLDIEFFGY